jgi:fumarate hydratase, class I
MRSKGFLLFRSGTGASILCVDQAAGGSLVMFARDNRGNEVCTACAKHRGFYLGSIGGHAAQLAKECVKKVDVLEYPELGMEAIWKIEVENFPAFVIDDKGNDSFTELNSGDAQLRTGGAICCAGDRSSNK